MEEKKQIAWQKIKKDFEKGLKVTELSKKYKLPATKIYHKVRYENWKIKNNPAFLEENTSIIPLKKAEINKELIEIYEKNKNDIEFLILTEQTKELAKSLNLSEEVFEGLFYKEIRNKFKKIAEINKNLYAQATNIEKPNIAAASLLLKKSQKEPAETKDKETLIINPYIANVPPKANK